MMNNAPKRLIDEAKEMCKRAREEAAREEVSPKMGGARRDEAERSPEDSGLLAEVERLAIPQDASKS